MAAPKAKEGLESAGFPNWKTPVLAEVVAVDAPKGAACCGAVVAVAPKEKVGAVVDLVAAAVPNWKVGAAAGAGTAAGILVFPPPNWNVGPAVAAGPAAAPN